MYVDFMAIFMYIKLKAFKRTLTLVEVQFSCQAALVSWSAQFHLFCFRFRKILVSNFSVFCSWAKLVDFVKI